MTEPDVLELDDVIKLLIGSRDERFQHERAVRLFQFQTWIYSPAEGFKGPKIAGQMVASLFLEKMGPLHLFSRKTNEQLFCAAKLAGLLENEPYQLLFDSVIARYGGWTALVRTPSLARFDKHISALRKEAHTTAKLIEYQFRYMEHGGADEKMANISHAMFFLYKGQPPIYGKTLRNRWRKHKKSSVFVYASELLGFNFYPPPIRSRGFLENLSKAAVNLKFNQKFFGTCAYIAAKLTRDHDLYESQADLLIGVPEKRPRTMPLSPDEMVRMDTYKAEYQKMRDS